MGFILEYQLVKHRMQSNHGRTYEQRQVFAGRKIRLGFRFWEEFELFLDGQQQNCKRVIRQNFKKLGLNYWSMSVNVTVNG